MSLAVLLSLALLRPVAAQEPGLTVAAWLERVQRQVFPYRVDADWFLLPAARPGVAAELGRVIDSNLPVELRARAVRALGQLALEPDVAIPKLGELLGHEEERIRREAVGAMRHFGRAAQEELWKRARDFTLIRNPPRSEPRLPAAVSLYAVAALAVLPDLDPRPLIDDYRRAVARGRWVDAGEPGTFPGSLEHLRTILTEIFRAPHEGTAAGLSPFFGDADPFVRELALDAATVIRDAGPILPALVRAIAAAKDPERARLIALLRFGGRDAIPVLRRLAEEPATATAEDVLGEMLWEESLEVVLGEFARAAQPESRDRLLLLLLSRINGRDLPPSLEPGLTGAVESYVRQDLTFRRIESVLEDGPIVRGKKGELAQAQPPLPWRIPAPLAQRLAEGLVATGLKDAKVEDLLNVLGHLGEGARGERVVAGVQAFEQGADEAGRAMLGVVLTGLGRPPADLASRLTVLVRDNSVDGLSAVVPLLDPATDVGRAALEVLLEAGKDGGWREVGIALPAFWRLVDSRADRARVARELAPKIQGEELAKAVRAVLARYGTPAERAAARPEITYETIWGPKSGDMSDVDAVGLAAAPARVKKEVVEHLLPEGSQTLPDGLWRIVLKAIPRDDSDFPWDRELAALAVRSCLEENPVIDFLATRPNGAEAIADELGIFLQLILAGNLDDLSGDQERSLELGLARTKWLRTPRDDLVAAVRRLAGNRQAPENLRRAALTALANFGPETVETQNIWAQAVIETDPKIRQAALDGIEKIVGRLPHLRPVWVAGTMREHEAQLTRQEAIWDGLASSAKAVEEAARKKAAVPAPVPTTAGAGVPPASAQDPSSFLMDLRMRMLAGGEDVEKLTEDAAAKRPDLQGAILATVATLRPPVAVPVARRLAALRPGTVPEIASVLAATAPTVWPEAAKALATDDPTRAPLLFQTARSIAGASAEQTLELVAAAANRPAAQIRSEAAQSGTMQAVTTAATAASQQILQMPAPPVLTATPQAGPPSAEMQNFQKIYFPWPPPPPVIWDEFGGEHAPLKRRWLGGDRSTLGEVEDRLRGSLGATFGELEAGLFPVPGGFALVTRIERIKATGQPYPGVYRWSTADSIRPDWPAWMFYEVPGYFRKIVFVVTSDFLPKWRAGFVIPDPGSGAKTLPPELRQTSFKDLKAYVLVYSYQRRPSGLYYPFGTLTAAQHVRMTGILRYFDSSPLR